MNVIKLNDELMEYPASKMVSMLLGRVKDKSYVFVLDMKYINELEDFKIVTRMSYAIESWVYIAFNTMFELIYLPGIGNDEVIQCKSTEIPQIERYMKLKKIIHKTKKSDC